MLARRIVIVSAVLAAVGAGAATASHADPNPNPNPLDAASAERLARKVAAREKRLPLPLPGTPDLATLPARLYASGLLPGSPLLIRIFKEESELEIWIERDDAYVHFATYPICYWSGGLGPKLREGDRQAPEGFYTITAEQLHGGGRWRRSLDIGFPNAFDRSLGRSGSYILIHGGCDSSGCFAMTNAVNAEIYDLVWAALAAGTVEHVPVHIFPFRMTGRALAARTGAGGKWDDYWANLKQGYDAFERVRRPPRIAVCANSYIVEEPLVGVPSAAGPVTACAPPTIVATANAAGGAIPVSSSLASAAAVSAVAQAVSVAPGEPAAAPKKRAKVSRAKAKPKPKKQYAARACTATLPSCRRWTALKEKRVAGAISAQRAQPQRRANLR